MRRLRYTPLLPPEFAGRAMRRGGPLAPCRAEVVVPPRPIRPPRWYAREPRARLRTICLAIMAESANLSCITMPLFLGIYLCNLLLDSELGTPEEFGIGLALCRGQRGCRRVAGPPRLRPEDQRNLSAHPPHGGVPHPESPPRAVAPRPPFWRVVPPGPADQSAGSFFIRPIAGDVGGGESGACPSPTSP